MASGYTNSHPRDEGSFYFETRFSWSSSYDPATNTSTVTFHPQIYTTVNMGNDLRMFDTKANNAGVYRDGSLIYAFSSGYGSGNYLRTWSNPYEDWCGLFEAGDGFPTLTVTHNNSGAASINMGLRGGVRSMYSGQEAYSSWIDDGYYINLSESRSLLIDYNANGGSGAPSPTYFYGSTEPIGLSSTIPTRPGYTFLGWSTSDAATTATYSAGQNIGTRTSSLALFAVWRINSYTVACEDRVGSSSGALLGTKTASYTYGSSVSGASFGSSTSYDAYYTGYHYTGSSSAITVDGNETVYRYFALNTWTVSYNANGHGTAPSSQTKTYGTALTLKSFIPNQTGTGTRADYTITGNANGGTWSGSNGSASRTPQYTYSQNKWNTQSDGTGTGYASGASYTANAATTLYAIWNTSTSYTYTYTLPSGTPTKNQTVTVTFNANGGSTTKTSQTSTRAMTFSGWYTAATGGAKRTTASQVSASETVYAHYSDGTSAYPSVTLPTASQCTRTGYTLLGFATSATATSAAYSPGESYTPTAGIKLYAVWQIISYSVSANISTRGITANILRTASPIGGAASGLLANGDTIYYGDVIKVSWALSIGYLADTLTVNGVDVSAYSPEEDIVTVTDNLTVVMTVKTGGVVYITNQPYQVFIWSGSAWEQYEAYIYNGVTWDAY